MIVVIMEFMFLSEVRVLFPSIVFFLVFLLLHVYINIYTYITTPCS